MVVLALTYQVRSLFLIEEANKYAIICASLHWTFAEEYSKLKLSAKFVTIRENRYAFLI